MEYTAPSATGLAKGKRDECDEWYDHRGWGEKREYAGRGETELIRRHKEIPRGYEGLMYTTESEEKAVEEPRASYFDMLRSRVRG